MYTRPVSRYESGQLKDVISDAPMSTEFACSRFLTPLLTPGGWALFMDSDILARSSVQPVFDQADPRYAVMVVKHQHEPDHMVKMDGQFQTKYARKNWSSVMLFNCEHPANKRLTLEMVNSVRGRDLHRFCWLEDHEIGELDVKWNYLVGISECPDPVLVHFTNGLPTLRGYENCEYADEWWDAQDEWAAKG